MTGRRRFGTLFLGGALLAVGVVGPAGAAPASAAGATLFGPSNRPCGGGVGTETFGTATLQSAKAKDAAPADGRVVRVVVAADKVRARTTYNVQLAATVVEGSSVGCRFWSAGVASSSAGGMLRFSGVVAVPDSITSFEVYVAPPGPSDVGYATAAVSVAGL